jgi:NifU-like protein involved in Fe-S cluster formation
MEFLGMHFEWTFRAGDIITAITFITAACAFLYRRGSTDTKLEMAISACVAEISEMKKELAKFADLMVKMAVQETKLNLLMKWYDELRNGKGIIVEPSDE